MYMYQPSSFFLLAGLGLLLQSSSVQAQDDGTVDCRDGSWDKYYCCTDSDCWNCETNVCSMETSVCENLGFEAAFSGRWESCDTLNPGGNGYSGGSSGDPHFRTWSGNYYDFMGACDLVLLRAPHFATSNDNGGNLDINIRTKMRYSYSYIESAVIKIGDDVLEVTSFGDYFLNGVSHADLDGVLLDDKYALTHEQPKKILHKFKIQIADDESITIKAYKDMVSVSVDNAKANRYRGSQGMMGEFGTGRLLARDGVSVLEDPNLLAAQWQVRHDEPMLFQSTQGPQHPQQCELPQTNIMEARARRRLGEGVAREAAAKACAGWKENMEGCIHDVMVTGDFGLAAAGLM